MIGLLVASGIFSIGLGLWHLGVPRWFDLATAIGRDRPGQEPLRPIVAGGLHYQTTRRDALSVAWVMNAAATYVLVSIGLVSVAAPSWLGTDAGRVLAAWIAGWWTIRAVMQVPFGRRRIDFVVMSLFIGLGATYLAAAVA